MNCFACHSSQTRWPWYAQLPFAKQMIQRDVEDGREAINLEEALNPPGRKPDLKTLKRIKYEIETDAMPPLEYKVMHWKSFLSRQDKQAILDWIREKSQQS